MAKRFRHSSATARSAALLGGCLLAVVVLVVLLASGVEAQEGDGGVAPSWLSLGDSYASGEGIETVSVEALQVAADSGLSDKTFKYLQERLIQRGRHDAAKIGA